MYTSGEVSLEARIADLVRDTALHFVLPRTSVSPLLMQGVLSAQEVAYAYAVWKFSFHFMNRLSGEMNALTNIIHASNTPRQAEALALVSKLCKHVQSHAFTESQILDAIFRNPSIVSWLYDQFAMRHRPRADAASYVALPRVCVRARSRQLRVRGSHAHMRARVCARVYMLLSADPTRMR
ncbi:hypothetical protein EON67_08195 [archaeon]|nr:MAG: hypothetical protein EON67_08195 [archaeon]